MKTKNIKVTDYTKQFKDFIKEWDADKAYKKGAMNYLKKYVKVILWWEEIDDWDNEGFKLVYVSKEDGAIENEAMSFDDLLEYEKE